MMRLLMRIFPLRLSVPAEAMLIIQIGVVAAAFSRGLNYLLIDTHVTLRESPVVALVNQALPLTVWGALFICAALLSVIGMLMPSLPTAVIGHSFLAGVYGVFGAGSFIYTITDKVPGGWQTGIGWLCVQCVIHSVLSDRCFDAWHDQRTAKRLAAHANP